MKYDNNTEAINHLSLCSGYEGIGLGLRRVLPNLREIAYVEREGFAAANLVAKMEAGALDAAPVFTDVKTFPYRKFRGLVDILSGGFPCQPFSNAGKREGVNDPRHLFPYIRDGIRECRPRIVFLENVEGIISAKTANGESVLQYVLRELEGLGYRTTAGVFSASEIGAPHQRKRVFIMGYAGSFKSLRLPNEQREESAEVREPGEPLAYSSSKRQGKWREPKNIFEKDERQIKKLPPKLGGSSKELADSKCRRRGEEGDESRKRSILKKPVITGGSREVDESNKWPSRPNETQKKWEQPRVLFPTKNKTNKAESELGGATYGSSCQVDRLRILGNGVVPATAAKAFVTLINRF
jgi:DNA (cytosine-5)-methyltransferase 1